MTDSILLERGLVACDKISDEDPINNPDGDAEIRDGNLIEYLINAALHEMIIKAARQAPGSTRDHDC